MTTALATIIDASTAGEIGLVLFVLIFLGVAVWTFTRSRHEVDHWADIPLDQAPQNPHNDDQQ